MRLPTSGNDPLISNRRRTHNHRIKTTVRKAFIIRGTPRIARKRKKTIYRIERANYEALLLAVMKEQARKRHG